MGHSTVTIKKEGMLSTSQILAAIRAKKEDHRDEYGHHQSPDSWTHADEPSTKFLDRVYSQSAMRDLKDREVNDYKSYAFYFVDQKTWNEFFRSKVQEKTIEKLKTKLIKLEGELEAFISKSLQESGLDAFKKAEGLDPEPKFWTCENCKSKVNMRMFYRRHRSMADQCPACGHDDDEILNSWRKKLIGQAYSKKRLKLETAIEELNKELQGSQNEEVSSISVSEVEKHKGLIKSVFTLIAADIHH